MTLTSVDVVNQALQLLGGNQPLVTGTAPTFDTSPAGVAAAQLYYPTVYAIGRKFGFDFSRNLVTLVATGNTPAFPSPSHEYTYPAAALQIRQVTGSTLADPNNPIAVNWIVVNVLVSSVPTKVIQTNIASAKAVITNAPAESLWDALYEQAVVRTLASGLAMALAGEMQTALATLDQGGTFESIAEARSDI